MMVIQEDLVMMMMVVVVCFPSTVFKRHTTCSALHSLRHAIKHSAVSNAAILQHVKQRDGKHVINAALQHTSAVMVRP
jgi:hypothetical protein